MDLFMESTLDAATTAQKAALAAESLGLGLCRSVPLFGLAIGKPEPASKLPAVKPRLPMEEVLHREYWNDDKQDQLVASYDKVWAIPTLIIRSLVGRHGVLT
ncbi:hypothetical protein FOXG_22199 [Fusarium oxysporum f. sp. lycopersici 4287]|uniref:Nitroreductase domain-containing protein n=1 Tax=Fusarium oxysporum f. sp. lycopersici (strain 4287 / CBS 123668 / FGSC 9935 / NRRL 34936) TaxID=426428 RepID=A0A0J9W638_FUSO4|nr:hypothetical protein FOXG_22064 [Fusarium oxysporum f. sp. lycopersici 4287]XP_018256393.1 uncharacterized protein FOXG_22199 [Fusarium oxysporum f. sp. lycopersici 4287]KNB17834.1 hypothetical protein FOXG_22064 [Fusarium oxysporum f. sp. lycopersici 4287]KNB18348.1 hypothetical protein FOXG_22199 [Fusarium oxysporum f. sp. lycopersici 4287]